MSTDFNPYAPPAAQLLPTAPRLPNDDGLWRQGKLLVLQKGAVLPDRCLRCNAPAPGRRLKRTLYWHAPGWYAFLIPIFSCLSFLLYVIVAMCVRHTARVEAPFCAAHRAKRRRAIALGWLGALAGIGLLVYGASRPNVFGEDDDVRTACMAAGAVTFFVSAIAGAIASNYLPVKRIDKHFVWLKRVSPEFLAPLPEWAPAGR